MTAKPLLFLDCFLDPKGGEDQYRPHLPPIDLLHIHAPFVEVPTICPDVCGVLISGSAALVADQTPWTVAAIRLVRDAVSRRIPLLGVCYGHQLLGEAVGGPGTVRHMVRPEVGFRTVHLRRGDPLFDVLPEQLLTFHTHGDEVCERPGLDVWGHSAGCAVQAMRVPDAPAWGVQFHTEYSRAMQLKLLARRAARHPELDIDPEREMQSPPDTPAQARALFGRFVDLIG
jgi:GMP synthase (glutamine-hydrolysing)